MRETTEFLKYVLQGGANLDTDFIRGDIVEIPPEKSWARICMKKCGEKFICEIMYKCTGSLSYCYRVRPVSEAVRHLCAERKIDGITPRDILGSFDIHKDYIRIVSYNESFMPNEDAFDSMLEV